MIAKIIPRKDGRGSFRDSVSYNLGISRNDPDKVEYVNTLNLIFPDAAIEEMDSLRIENPRVADPVFNYILSWRENEIPSREQTDEAVNITLKELELEGCQVHYALHKNTDSFHLHVCVNRIDPTTYKPRDPAHGWTKKALERAARKIETAQGWEIEQTGRYFVSENGEISEKESHERKLSAKARDVESRFGSSAEGEIRDAILASIRGEKAASWQEFHHILDGEGIRFEKKGSGAIFIKDGVAVKASNISRDCAFSKLSARFGEYECKKDRGIQDNQGEEEFSNLTETNREQFSSGPKAEGDDISGEERKPVRDESYKEQKAAYLRLKKEEWGELRDRQKQERAELSRRQKEERKRLYSGNAWQGKGRQLNTERSVLAASQAALRAETKDRQNAEWRELKAKYRPFPDYAKWIFERDGDEKKFSMWKYRRSEALLLPGEPVPPSQAAEPKDIRSCEYAVQRDGVAYFVKGSGNARPSFIDHGRQITVRDWRSREAVLASLQLAAQKWGSVSLTGSEEYQRLCVSVCLEANIRVTNPELQESISAEKQRIQAERATAKNPAAEKTPENVEFLRYAEAVGADRYRVTVLHMSEALEGGERRGFILDKNREGTGENFGIAPETVSERIGYMRYRQNAKGDNIYYTPLSKDKHHILVDDMNREKLDEFLADGYRPAAILESSPGNFQAVLTIPKTGAEETVEKAAANALASALNTAYGDPKIHSAIQAHRAPGFENRKPKHRREDGTYPGVVLRRAARCECEKAMEALRRLALETEERRAAAWEKEKEYQARLKDSGIIGQGKNPGAAYLIHARDIIAHFAGSGGGVNYNQVDSMTAVRMRVTGYTKGEVEGAIKDNAASIRPEDRKESHNWPLYAERTAAYAYENPGADREAYAMERKRRIWMSLEGRVVKPERERTPADRDMGR